MNTSKMPFAKKAMAAVVAKKHGKKTLPPVETKPFPAKLAAKKK